MMIPVEQFLSLCDKIAGKTVNRPNAKSLYMGMEYFPGADIWDAHILAQFMAQITHESMDFRHDREIWNPKQVPAQGRYDTRTDLGNTPQVDNDGYLNRGMGPIQLTGGANRRAFAEWCRSLGMDPPEFVETENLLTDPWEGLSAVWYWEKATGKSLSTYAEEGNIEAITRKINGGLNGYLDRCRRYARCGLAMLNYDIGKPASVQEKEAIKKFQRDAGFTGGAVDGIAGRDTREALHRMLKEQAIAPIPVPMEYPVVKKYLTGEYYANVDPSGNLTIYSRE